MAAQETSKTTVPAYIWLQKAAAQFRKRNQDYESWFKLWQVPMKKRLSGRRIQGMTSEQFGQILVDMQK